MPALPGLRGYLAALTALGVGTAVVVLIQADGLATLLTGGGVSVALVIAVATRIVLVVVQGLLTSRFAAAAQAGLRRRLLGGTGDPGATATRITKGVDATEAYLTGYLPATVLSALLPIAVLSRLFTADLASALIVTATVPLIPVFGALIGAHTKARTQWTLLTRLGGHFLDVVRGLPTLKLFGRAQAQARIVREMADAYADATIRTLKVAFLSALVLELVATLSIALVAVPIGFRLLSGSMTAHTAMLVLVLAPEAYLPLRAAGAKFHAAAEGLTAMKEILAVPAVSRHSGARTRRLGAPELVFDRVSVHYGDVRALSEVDLTIRPGEHVALVGPSGSGKSTLLSALLGFVPPTSGRILVDGVDLRSLDHESWLRDTAWLPQRPTLFRGTLLDNTGGRPVDDVVTDLPDGYATQVGELGAGLSAGQRQRVGLARALSRTDAGLVLLDEPTARLDAATEASVLTGTREMLPGRTAVLVAHRPALSALATRTVALSHGAIA